MVGPNGEEHWAIAQYKQITPQQSFVSVDAFTNAEGVINTNMPQSTWNLNFKAMGEHSVVDIVIQYQDIEHLEMIIKMGFKEGLGMGMQNLDELLASKK